MQPSPQQRAEVRQLEMPAANERRIMELQSLQRELASQLEATQSQRAEAMRMMEEGGGMSRAIMMERAKALNDRLESLERRMSEAGQELAMLSPGHEAVVAVGPPGGPFENRNLVDELGFNPLPVAILFVIFVLGPISAALARRMWNRGRSASLPAGLSEVPDRLGRLEQAVDTVAVEVERISEGQRFVSKLLAEQASRAAALGEGDKVSPPR